MATNLGNIPIQIGSRVQQHQPIFNTEQQLKQISVPSQQGFKQQNFPYQVNFYNKITV
jgi:hypothetical protein